MVKTIQFHCPKYTLLTPCALICCQFLLGKTVAPREIEDSRSFSHDVTAAIFVDKTMNRRPCLCEKILWELHSFHMLKLSFNPSNLQSCWQSDWKRSICGVNKVYYGWCENGECMSFLITGVINSSLWALDLARVYKVHLKKLFKKCMYGNSLYLSLL